ncbi:MAG: NUDIX hydrolase [Phycisphaerae bacterium]|nr:NUDIX hydrolase [Phycisphaerae bacterium]
MRHARLKSWSEARAIIRRRQREFLIVRPAGNPDAPWSFAGGRLHSGEHAAAGLRRICCAVIGQDVQIIGGCIKSTFGYAFHTVDYRYYLCELMDTSATVGKHHDARWILLPQLREYYFDPPTQFVVDKLLEALHRQ